MLPLFASTPLHPHAGGRQHITRRWLLCHSITIGLWFFILLLLTPTHPNFSSYTKPPTLCYPHAGGRQHITRRWLLCHSITIGLWFFILLLLVLIIVGQSLWLATAYAIDKAALVGVRSMEG